MNTTELLECIRDSKISAEAERKIVEELLKQATENAISMSKFVLDNPEYFSDSGIKRAKEYLKEEKE